MRMKHFTQQLSTRLAPLTQWLVARLPFLRNARVRAGMGLMAAVFVVAELFAVLQPYLTPHSYALGAAGALLAPISQPMAAELKYNTSQQVFAFNNGSSAPVPGLIGGAGTQASATAYTDASKGISVTDPVNKINFTLTPQFDLWAGRQDGNRVVYPLTDGNGWTVYTMHSIGVKEDILLDSASHDTLSFGYSLDLSSGLQARFERDGSIGIYGNTLLSSNITTATAKDAALLEKARLQAPKNTLIFRPHHRHRHHCY